MRARISAKSVWFYVYNILHAGSPVYPQYTRATVRAMRSPPHVVLLLAALLCAHCSSGDGSTDTGGTAQPDATAIDGGTRADAQPSIDATGGLDALPDPPDAEADGGTASPDATPAGGDGAVTIGPTGGVVPATGAMLHVPAGALGAPVTITAQTLTATAGTARASSLRSPILRFGPDGTRFASPAILDVEVVGALTVDGQAVVARREGARWVPVPTIVVGGRAYGLVDHFTDYALLEILVAETQTFCDFQRCGGPEAQVIAPWHLASECRVRSPAVGPGCSRDPTERRLELDVTQTLRHDLDLRNDGTYSTTAQQQITRMMHLPAGCIEPVAPGITSCTELAARLFPAGFEASACTQLPIASGCFCYAKQPADAPFTASGTFTVHGENEGNTLEFVPGTGAGYCIAGGRLELGANDGSVETFTR